ncbi:inositol polyphosphate phosphatase [Trametopsis cervina]|nr:inositol polyphosphate phosphatase [Trametopsis cervina]
MHLYLAENPRALFLAASTQDGLHGPPDRVLVFRGVEGKPSQAIVEFLPRHEVDLTNAVKLSNRIIKGCLGLISIAGDMFLAVITSATEVGNIRPSGGRSESVAKIHEVGFYCLTSAAWDDLVTTYDAASSPSMADHADNLLREGYRDSGASTPNSQLYEHPCMPLQKIIGAGTFYYALQPHWDLSSRLSQRLKRNSTAVKDLAVYDDRFIWNEYMVRSLLDFRERLEPQEREDFDSCQFIVLVIQGYVGVFQLPLPAPPTNGSPMVATISLISRLGWKRAGTRFNTRGVDDDGNCANFVETETIFSTEMNSFSFTQVRGSVPLFWEQQGLQTFGQRIQITRPQASQPAFERHFVNLSDEYGAVHAINLLGTKENEATLTAAYARHLQIARNMLGDSVKITHFDFHNAVRLYGHDAVIREIRRQEAIADEIEAFGFTMADALSDDVITIQKGVFRTNCLDCLDRTNFVQDILSRIVMEQYLSLVRREWLHVASLWSYHRELWAENGDALSRIYAGTGALNTSYTRSGKRTLAGVLSDATKSVSRAYINNFQDKGKQIAIDIFLGNISSQKQVTIFDPIHDIVRDTLDKRLAEYSTTKSCIVFAGTWNVNGHAPTSESLLPWLFPRPSIPDIIAIGFQEIVPLTAQQIVQTDPEKRRIWEAKLTETLGKRPNKKSEYVFLRSQQLVGTALLILVKTELAAVIRNVEAATHKTGLRGISGNKGAVAIRLDYYDSDFCFITAHLAAGHNNVEERNADYHTITNGLHFLKGKTIDSHQNVIWLADMNYRIDLQNESVRHFAQVDDYDALLAADQLRQVLDHGIAFAGYEEGPVLFRPTYKYDYGSDNYDTSEKMRIPAWTDRILFKGPSLTLSVYSRAELKGSDHRPVFAIFRAEIRVIDHAKRASLSRLLLDNVTSTAPGEKLDEKLASLAFSSDIPDLPPPSSDDMAWWDGPGHRGGVFPLDLSDAPHPPSDPFDSPAESPLSSPSSSEEELYNKLALQEPLAPEPAPAAISARRPPPPPPRTTKPQSKDN